LRTSPALIALLAVLTAGCATKAPNALDARLPPAQFFDARVQPARLAPNPQGAAVLSSGTGCDVIYIAPGTAADGVVFALRPTSRVPDAARCSERLREQPGMESLTPTQLL
jgi:hypothetical protein